MSWLLSPAKNLTFTSLPVCIHFPRIPLAVVHGMVRGAMGDFLNASFAEGFDCTSKYVLCTWGRFGAGRWEIPTSRAPGGWSWFVGGEIQRKSGVGPLSDRKGHQTKFVISLRLNVGSFLYSAMLNSLGIASELGKLRVHLRAFINSSLDSVEELLNKVLPLFFFLKFCFSWWHDADFQAGKCFHTPVSCRVQGCLWQ